eukprot:9235610-Heterocapsa_arctica.AAC.1
MHLGLSTSVKRCKDATDSIDIGSIMTNPLGVAIHSRKHGPRTGPYSVQAWQASARPSGQVRLVQDLFA